MPADYLSRNVVKALDISNEDLGELQDQDNFFVIPKTYIEKTTCRKIILKIRATND
jgi:hypothetical protein